MINGVLVERTVKDVVPSLKTNSDGLKQVLDELLKQYKTKQGEMDSWKVSAFSICGCQSRYKKAGKVKGKLSFLGEAVLEPGTWDGGFT